MGSFNYQSLTGLIRGVRDANAGLPSEMGFAQGYNGWVDDAFLVNVSAGQVQAIRESKADGNYVATCDEPSDLLGELQQASSEGLFNITVAMDPVYPISGASTARRMAQQFILGLGLTLHSDVFLSGGFIDQDCGGPGVIGVRVNTYRLIGSTGLTTVALGASGWVEGDMRSVVLTATEWLWTDGVSQFTELGNDTLLRGTLEFACHASRLPAQIDVVRTAFQNWCGASDHINTQPGNGQQLVSTSPVEWTPSEVEGTVAGGTAALVESLARSTHVATSVEKDGRRWDRGVGVR